ncbi:MAG: thermonuclease family protein [Aquificae bacterium]|nr:thermonuclease family protein [Aquificota bacterium]
MQQLIPLILRLLRSKKGAGGLLATLVAVVLVLVGGEGLLEKEKTVKRTETYAQTKTQSAKPTTLSIKPNSKIKCVVVRVYDGDTFKCRTKDGQELKVRLIGVDTPESSKNLKAYRDAERSGMDVEKIVELGKKAKEFTKKLLPKGTEVILETDVQPFDKYGRVLAYVWLPDGRMLNEVLVREGYATVYTIPPNVKYVERLREAQRYAIEHNKGLWAEGLKK